MLCIIKTLKKGYHLKLVNIKFQFYNELWMSPSNDNFRNIFGSHKNSVYYMLKFHYTLVPATKNFLTDDNSTLMF